MTKKAVILFNLGGPDSLDAVKPFLFNLFNDKAIISAPNPIRFFLAKAHANKLIRTAPRKQGIPEVDKEIVYAAANALWPFALRGMNGKAAVATFVMEQFK